MICTIHQPSASVFASFDSLVLLAQGRVAYYGESAKATAAFDRLGLQLPPRENPAEAFMRWLQDDSTVAKMLEGAADRAANGEASPRLDVNNGGAGSAEPPGLLRQSQAYSVSRLTQAAVLTRRTITDQLKDTDKALKGCVLKTFIGALIGVVWFAQAGSTVKSIFPVEGAMFIAVFNSTMDTVLVTAMDLPMSRALLRREYRNGARGCAPSALAWQRRRLLTLTRGLTSDASAGWYALPPYQLATILVHCVLQTFNALCGALPIYFLVGLRLELLAFVVFVAALAVLSWIGVAFGLTVGAVANDIKQAQAAIAPSMVPLLLFSGYMIPYAQIPSYFRWLYDISFFQYGLAILQINQFAGMNFTDCPPPLPAGVPPACAPLTDLLLATCYPTGDDYLRQSNIEPDDIWRDFGFLGGYVVVLSVASYYVTRWAVRSS